MMMMMGIMGIMGMNPGREKSESCGIDIVSAGV